MEPLGAPRDPLLGRSYDGHCHKPRPHSRRSALSIRSFKSHYSEEHRIRHHSGVFSACRSLRWLSRLLMCLPYHRGHDVSLSPGSVTRSGVDGAILSRKEKRVRLGQSSRGPNPAPTRLPGRGNRAELLPVSRGLGADSLPGVERRRQRRPKAHAQLRGRALKSAGRGGARGAGRGVRLQPRQAEPALPRGGARAVLTLAAEPEVVRGCGQRWPVVAFPSSRAPRSRRPAVCGPRAPASRPPGPASPGLPRSARPRPGGRSQRPGLRASSLRRPEGRRAGGRRAGEPDGGWGRWRRREHGRQAANPHGQREAQQEHHPARQRRQDLEERSRREGVRRTLVIGPLHFCCLWFCNFPDYSKYQDGHVK